MLATRQVGIERSFLQRRADDLSYRRAFVDDVEARDARRASARRQQRREHVDGRRLAGAVRP